MIDKDASVRFLEYELECAIRNRDWKKKTYSLFPNHPSYDTMQDLSFVQQKVDALTDALEALRGPEAN